MRILIVDDEYLARDRLKRILETQTTHEVVGEAANGQQALAQIEQLHPEVVLLDIRMPGMDGVEVARHLADMDEPPAVIFTSAYDEHALDAFKVQAVDYLLKPVRQECLVQALSKALKPNKLQWQALNQAKDGSLKERTHISSRTRLGIVLVPVSDVYYFRAEHKYVTVRHVGGEVLIEETLKALEKEFKNAFMRIHRNCLVATKHFQALEKNGQGMVYLCLREIPDKLEVSRRHLPALRQRMRG